MGCQVLLLRVPKLCQHSRSGKIVNIFNIFNIVNKVVQARFLKNDITTCNFDYKFTFSDHDSRLYCSSWTLSRSRSRTFSWEARSPTLGWPPPVGAVKMRSSGLTLWSGSSQGDDDGGGDDGDIMMMMEPPRSFAVIENQQALSNEMFLPGWPSLF